MIQTVCDLCGKPISNREGTVKFKYKECGKIIRNTFLGCIWNEIDVCPDCIETIAKSRKEQE